MLKGTTQANQCTQIKGRRGHHTVKHITFSITSLVPSMQGSLERAVDPTGWYMGAIPGGNRVYAIPCLKACCIAPSKPPVWLPVRRSIPAGAGPCGASFSEPKQGHPCPLQEDCCNADAVVEWGGSNSRASNQVGVAVHFVLATRCSGCLPPTFQRPCARPFCSTTATHRLRGRC